jgi:ribosomal protein L11 methylase PrmA
VTTNGVIPSSFRDPSGFVFVQDGTVYRQVNRIYGVNYDHLLESGLYRALTDAGLMVGHEEVGIDLAQTEDAYKILRPEQIGFISYPYEWCFSQLKDAALTTLTIQKKAFDFGMTLKDSSAFNIQFSRDKPTLIDTLSFEKYRQGQTWPAYRQFCQHFLAPLALMSRRDVRLSQLLRIHIDGIPLDLASKLLPRSSWLDFSLVSHIHLHAKSQSHFADKPVNVKSHKMSKLGFRGIIDSLETAVGKMKWQPSRTQWGDYYEDTNYSDGAMNDKKRIVAAFLERLNPAVTWDIGANTGIFSRIAAAIGSQTISFDVDPAAVEKNYLECVDKKEKNILPLVLDLANPSGPIGWANQERCSLLERGPADAVLALAIVHHLAISNNLPFDKIAGFFHKICRWLIIEFIPKNDSQVQRMLTTRDDIFSDYEQQIFENIFGKYFTIQSSVKIKDSERTLYLLQREN